MTHHVGFESFNNLFRGINLPITNGYHLNVNIPPIYSTSVQSGISYEGKSAIINNTIEYSIDDNLKIIGNIGNNKICFGGIYNINGCTFLGKVTPYQNVECGYVQRFLKSGLFGCICKHQGDRYELNSHLQFGLLDGKVQLDLLNKTNQKKGHRDLKTGITYSQPLNENMNASANVKYDMTEQSMTGTAGYEFCVDNAKFTTNINTKGIIQSVLEETLYSKIKVSLSAEINHKKEEYKYGVSIKFAQF